MAEQLDPGPIDKSVLTDQERHRSCMGVGALACGRPQRLKNGNWDAALDDKPLGCRWNAPLRWRENVKTSDIEFYRNELDIQMESQVNLVVDIQERIKDVLANTTVPQDVAETLNQIEGRISSVLDGFKLLHVSCSLPISKCNIRTNSSQEHQNSGDQPANDQTQPSSPLAHSTDDQLTVATTALVELGPPALGSPVADSNATITPPLFQNCPRLLQL
uniref:Uncharacterized protein n=1 Tax=Ananas comosus var. bracteatus TaxID=296719 RepID=A0A6V7P3H4_ANACO|nr:unnamed protein product [Ananas comosus var. bracteatus]